MFKSLSDFFYQGSMFGTNDCAVIATKNLHKYYETNKGKAKIARELAFDRRYGSNWGNIIHYMYQNFNPQFFGSIFPKIPLSSNPNAKNIKVLDKCLKSDKYPIFVLENNHSYIVLNGIGINIINGENQKVDIDYYKSLKDSFVFFILEEKNDKQKKVSRKSARIIGR